MYEARQHLPQEELIIHWPYSVSTAAAARCMDDLVGRGEITEYGFEFELECFPRIVVYYGGMRQVFERGDVLVLRPTRDAHEIKCGISGIADQEYDDLVVKRQKAFFVTGRVYDSDSGADMQSLVEEIVPKYRSRVELATGTGEWYVVREDSVDLMILAKEVFDTEILKEILQANEIVEV